MLQTDLKEQVRESLSQKRQTASQLAKRFFKTTSQIRTVIDELKAENFVTGRDQYGRFTINK